MKLILKIKNGEKGHALILSLIILFVGSVVTTSLLGFVATGSKAGQMYQENIKEYYAADAGVKHAIHKIIKDDESLVDLEDNDSYDYSLPGSVNGLPINITITKHSLIQGILGEDEYKLNQPHESWMDFYVPPEETNRNYEEGWVEYSCNITFHYDGSGSRKVETVGSFFSPAPGEGITIDEPYNVNTSGAMTLNNLESFEIKETGGGFAFIWRWAGNLGPQFDNANRDGSLTYNFKVYDPDWMYLLSFSWATFKEQDVSFVTSLELSKWLIEVTAGDITVRSSVMRQNDTVDILTWEIVAPS